MRRRLLSFLMVIIFCSSCQKTVEEVGFATCILKNTTGHKIGITFHYHGGEPNKTFVIEKNSQTKVEEIDMEGGATGYDRPYFWYSYPTGTGYTDSISVLYDQSVLIRHYLDTIKRRVKSYNRKSDRSLLNPKSYIRTVSKNPVANSDQVLDVQLLYTFTEDDYLFAK